MSKVRILLESAVHLGAIVASLFFAYHREFFLAWLITFTWALLLYAAITYLGLQAKKLTERMEKIIVDGVKN